MKVAITGHSEGIGNALLTLINHKTNNAHSAMGFSRLNGYDLQNVADRGRALNHAVEAGCTVFVNNAYQPGGMQIEMFDHLIKAWNHHPDKTIVNVISRAVYTGSPENPEYATWKRELSKRAQDANFRSHLSCRVINVYPGLTDTGSVKMINRAKMTAEQVAEQIWWAIQSPVHIQEMVFGARTDK
jgi:short-subunit dehydrogenase